MSRRARLCTPALVLAAALAGAPAAAAGPSGGVSPPVIVGNSPSGGVAVHGSGGPSGSGSGGPTGSSSSRPTVSGSRGVLKGGLAYAPAKAPAAVKAVIWAANKIRHKPYKWGGGHGRWDDTGYDCSGAVSFALHGAGLLDSPLDSRGFMRYGDAGTGRWITVYGSNGHAYMIVAGLRFDTSGRGESGPRWRPEPPWERNFTARHPRGL